jgi:predicted amidohydrolase YtcJ
VREPDSSPDFVLVGSRVLTMADGLEPAEAVAVAGGRIVATASRSDLERLAPAGTPILDVGSRTICPGFVDPHAHGEVAARVIATTVDCRAPGSSSIEDVIETLREHLGRADNGWLVAQANLFFDQKLLEGRLPTRAELDDVSPDTAIALRAGGHVTVLNTRALELSGITRDYEPPTHSVTGRPIVERDDTGLPTGVVKEMDNVLPLPTLDGSGLGEALAFGMRELFTRNGVTAVGEISETIAGLRTIDRLQRTGDLPLRVYTYLWAPGTMTLEEACAWQEILGDVGPLLSIKGVKLFADGGYSAASAAVKHDYVGRPGWKGALALTRQQVADALTRTKEAGLQLALHANGDRAQEEVCAAIETAGGAPSGPLRTRVEHAGNFAPDRATTTDWWRRAGIVPVPQPVFLYSFGDYFPTYLGDQGLSGRFAFRSLLDEGWRLSGSSDVWVGSEQDVTNPLFGIWCCVCRRTYGDATIDLEQRCTVEEAFAMHTKNAAEALGEGHALGSIEPGKAADLTVLDRDPLSCPEDDLRHVRVDAVFLDGRGVYTREASVPIDRATR